MKSIWVGVLLTSIAAESVAQDAHKMTVPASPAFSVLNFEPGAIMRPSSARELAADVLNSFDKSGKLLLNLGLEVTPYWMRSHPRLKRDTYLNPDAGQAFLQSFSLSAATVKDSVSGANKFGAGFRFKLSNGKPVNELFLATAEQKAQNNILNAINVVRLTLDESDTKKSVIEAIVKNLQAINTASQVIVSVKKQAEKIAAGYTDSNVDLKLFMEKLISLRVANDVELSERISNLIYQRRGFILEFAGASGYNGSDKSVDQIGFWGNASYSISAADLFTITARYLYNSNDTSAANLDLGIGFLKKTAAYNISVEAMFRNYSVKLPGGKTEKDFTTRFAMQGSYAVSKTVSINLSLGKDFDSPFISRTGFFSILGLNYSIFNKTPTMLTD